MATKVSNLSIDLQSGTTDTAYATWSFSKSNLDHYKVVWKYSSGDGVLFAGQTSTDITLKNDTYTIPSNALYIQVTVTPVSKTYTKNKKTKSYWTGTAVSKKINIKTITVPATPSGPPTVSIDGYKLTMSVDIDDSNTSGVDFRIYQNSSIFGGDIEAKKSVGTAKATKTINAGYRYKVRYQPWFDYGSLRNYGSWSDVSDEIAAIPAQITGVSCSATGSTTAKVTWTKDSSATSYEIQYTTKKAYFDTSSEVSTETVEGKTTCYVTGLDSGYVYYFRVRGVNDDDSTGSWSSIVSTAVGTTPEAPTTWSSTTTAIVGEDVTLYWIHNTEDGSHQKGAQIQLVVDGSTSTISYSNEIGEEDAETQYSYILDLSSYTSGVEIKWKVRTKGVTGDYSDWSIQRTITLYETPSLILDGVTNNGADYLSWLPIFISADAVPLEQTPTGYYVSIIAMNSYETENYVGQTVYVSAGDEVYGKQFNVSSNLLTLEISAGDVTLENGETYKVTVTVSMDSGLTAEASRKFTVEWENEENEYDPDASISIDMDTLSAFIMPFCEDEDENLIEGVTLSVYRREFDGSFTEIASDLDNDKSVTVTDPHPALDYARYRIVATDDATGVVSYSDLPGEPVGEPSIVLQWDEEYTQFDYSDDTIEDALDQPLWQGSMLKLKGNVDTSESYSFDTSLVEYIGRKYPVSYYGTQVGSTASWSTDVPKDDEETLYQLRKLAVYAGDVYVREPSGTGYWAQVSVSMSLTHCELVVPVTLSIKRVEGGV